MTPQARRLEIVLFILILLVGASLRLVALDAAPPGLTHDEADHGLDAAGVLEGRRPIYFTVGYGREPLYDYATALVMLVVGKTYLASRITAALFGIALLILTYAWVRLSTQNRWLALATMAGLAVSFWAVSTSRHALRTVTLPVMFMAAALVMRKGFTLEEDVEDDFILGYRPRAEIERWVWFLLAGLFLGLSFYTYLAARLMWLVFPAFFLFLSLTQPGVIRRIWPGLLVMLIVGAIVAAPLALYLMDHPQAELRISQLSSPIAALRAGDPAPLLRNARAGLGMITITGDNLWLYNIPGRPLLGPVMSLLFYLGISIALISVLYPYRPVRRGLRTYDDAFRISTANTFMLLTLAAGLFPALITGAGASNTRVIGMQPALYYFPALAIVWMAEWADRRFDAPGWRAIWTTFGLLTLIRAGQTFHDYFTVWNNARNVRVAYHTTLVETLAYIDAHPELGSEIALSSITPGRFHDPAVARMRLRRDDVHLKWFDGRSVFLFPSDEDLIAFYPEVAAPDPAFAPWLESTEMIDRIVQRPDDFNRTVQVIRLPGAMGAMDFGDPPVQAGDVAILVDSQISPSDTATPGDTLEVITIWQVIGQPAQDLALFTHALDPSGVLIAQQDLLGYSAEHWQSGDLFAQLHRITLPADAPSGRFSIRVGIYSLPDIARLPLTDSNGASLGDNVEIGTLEIVAP